jgi:outer membrane lipoprotein-sorting protein
MNTKHTLGLIALLLAVALVAAPRGAAQDRDPRIDEIIDKLDDLYRSKSSYAVIEMDIVTPHWERTLKMEAWTEGLDKTFIRIQAPRKEEGMGTLRIDNEMWNYLPKVNKVIKVPPSMMSSSWMGSDFTNDDLVNEVTLREDYVVEFATVDSPQPGLLYIKATPKEGVPVVWGYYITAVREDSYLPVWEEYYDDDGRAMRRAEFSDVGTFDGRTLPATMTMTPLSEEKKGHRTTLRYKEIEFNVDIENDIFTLRNLRSR